MLALSHSLASSTSCDFCCLPRRAPHLKQFESILDTAWLDARGNQDEAALAADALHLVHAEAAFVVDALDERPLLRNERLEEGNRPRRAHPASEIIAPPVD